MTDEFGTPQWVDENIRRQKFMEILYESYGRGDKDHPQHGHYTGLWEQFLYDEAGTFARDMYFNREMRKAEMMAEIEQLEQEKKEHHEQEKGQPAAV